MLTAYALIRILQEEEGEDEKEKEKEIEKAKERLEEKKILSSHPKKWDCLLCNFVNFESVSVCFSCGNERRAGPVGPDELFKHCKDPSI
jgi:rubrerythrin